MQINPLHSVALQEHILSKYLHISPKKKNVNLNRQRQSRKSSETSDVYLDTRTKTLAQRLDLLPSTEISISDWTRIKTKALSRQDLSCPICQEGFQNSTQIILNCSHIFHHNCFISFERLSAHRHCPVCRLSDYKRLQTTDASLVSKNRAAIVIQKFWRGYKQRLWFWGRFELTNPLSRRKRLYREMAISSKKMQAEVKREDKVLSVIFDKLDEEYLKVTRDIRRILISTAEIPELKSRDSLHWEFALSKALKRGPQDCAICLQPVKLPTGSSINTGITILSCSHCMHKNCHLSYQSFFSNPTCPVCRASSFQCRDY